MRVPLRARLGTLALLLSGCSQGEEASAPRPPPVSPPAETWDLSKLPATGKPLEVRTTPEGVRILVLERGDGQEVTEATPFDVHFRGYLLSGVRFEDGTLPLGGEGRPTRARLLPGLRAGVEGMQSGERRRVLVPSAQAYGWNAPRGMPPGGDLVFDLQGFAFRLHDLEVGQGAEAQAGATVTVHYVGTFLDGREFESSRKLADGKPATFALRGGREGVISGWVLGLPGMRVGGRRRLALPSTLAYGAPGNPQGRIPPHADLVFTIDLLGVAPPPAAPPAGLPPR